MSLDEMINDFISRAKTRYTAEHVKTALEQNYSLVTEDGFICFSIAIDECYVLFCYVRPGAGLKPFQWAVEEFARREGCKVLKWLTHREKAFSRAVTIPGHPLYGYKPSARMFEKDLTERS